MEARLLETARLAGNRVGYIVPFINLALATAMRRGELCSLAWDDVDMENRSYLHSFVKSEIRTLSNHTDY